MNFSVESSYTRALLQTQQVKITRIFSGFMLQEAHTNIMKNELNQMVVDLASAVRTHNLPPDHVEKTATVSVETPASWWDHWKYDVAANTRGLRWIARRWPPRMKTKTRNAVLTVDLRRFHVYPDAPASPGTWLEVAIPSHTLDTHLSWRRHP